MGRHDGDGYGDNPSGMVGDNCPTHRNSTEGLLGCADKYGMVADLVDDLTNEITQWEDLDGDGYGDNKSA